MNYTNFKNKVAGQPLFRSVDIEASEPNVQVSRNRLMRWEKQGLVQKLRKGAYILNASDRKIEPIPQFIANQLYAPSYVSLEYAMNMSGIIPERVMGRHFPCLNTDEKNDRWKTFYPNLSACACSHADRLD